MTVQELGSNLEVMVKAVESAPIGICITEPSRQDNPIIYVNTYFEEMTGYEEEELIGKNCRFLKGEETEKEPVQKLKKAIEEEKEVTVEMKNYRKDGTGFWNQVKIAPLEREDGKKFFVEFHQNITEIKEKEEMISRKNTRMDQFTGLVSHDLKNPLNVARGWLELAIENRETEALENALEAIDRSLEMIEGLRTLAKEGKVKEMQEVNLEEITNTCWNEIETDDANLEIESDSTIMAGRTQLQQLLDNLLKNAVEHGGEDVKVRVGELEDGFYVEDNGPGIPEDERKELFNSRYLAAEEGAGFGLLIVKEIVDAHGWNIEMVESDGARFEITGVKRIE